MAIVARLTPVAFGVIFALSGAIGPIIGQNAGAGEGARVRLPIATRCCSRRSWSCRSAWSCFSCADRSSRSSMPRA
jgi:hypothetical protein